MSLIHEVAFFHGQSKKQNLIFSFNFKVGWWRRRQHHISNDARRHLQVLVAIDVVQCHLGQKCFRRISQTKENFNYSWIVDAQRLVTVCPHLKRLSKYRRFLILNISLPLLPLDLPDFWVWCLRGSRFHPESFVMFVGICVWTCSVTDTFKILGVILQWIIQLKLSYIKKYKYCSHHKKRSNLFCNGKTLPFKFKNRQQHRVYQTSVCFCSSLL